MLDEHCAGETLLCVEIMTKRALSRHDLKKTASSAEELTAVKLSTDEHPQPLSMSTSTQNQETHHASLRALNHVEGSLEYGDASVRNR